MNAEELEDQLSERMQHLADQVPAPAVDAGADLARGRRHARGRRIAGVAAAAAVGVLVGGTGYLVHAAGPGQGASDVDTSVAAPGESGHSTVTRPPLHAANEHAGNDANERAKRRAAKRALEHSWRDDPRLKGYRAAIAAVLDPAGEHLAQVSGMLGGAGVLGTRLGWKDGAGEGEIMVTVAGPGAGGGGFSSFDSARCEATAAHPCTPVELPDGTTGQQQTRDGALGVYYTRPDREVVLIVESTLFGNDATVPVDALPATAKQLLRAASDPRMSLAR